MAMPQRGLFTGNRGIIHDPESKTLLPRRWSTKAWIICRCDYKDARRVPMAGRSWTELFFFDEAIALAAGHRPCFLCRRSSAQAFRAAWAAGLGQAPPSAVQIDEILHSERLDEREKRVHPLLEPPSGLPDGTLATAKGGAYVVVDGLAYGFSATGYSPAPARPGFDGILTPPSAMAALRSGYRAVLHSSLAALRHRV